MYRDVVQLLDHVKDDSAQFVALFSLSIVKLNRLDRARLNSKFGKRLEQILDAEGRLSLEVDVDANVQQQALDIAWKHLRANKFQNFFLLFTISDAAGFDKRLQQTIAYRECRDKYNSMLTDLGLQDHVEPASQAPT